MRDGVVLSGGPYNGVRITIGNRKDSIGLGLDEQYERETAGKPFALALYRLGRERDDDDEYLFDRIIRIDGKMFQGEFLGGPVAGPHEIGQPVEFGPEIATVPLNKAGDMFDGAGEVDSVAVYRRERADGRWIYRFEGIDRDVELKAMRHLINVRRAKIAIQGFYDQPNYDIYSIQPTDEHPQESVQVGRRRAKVDVGVARLIELLWRLEFDTIGSCQKRSSGTSIGMAYVALPIPGHGEALLELLQRSGLECTLKQKILGIKNEETGEKLEIPCAHIHFDPDLIPGIEMALQAAIEGGYIAPS